MILSPSLRLTSSSASTILFLWSLLSGSSSCTFSRKVSYIDAFFVFASSTIMRNDTRSSDHSTTSVRAWIVAVRGQLYIKASSPKESPTPNDLTYLGSAPASELVTKASRSPESTT